MQPMRLDEYAAAVHYLSNTEVGQYAYKLVEDQADVAALLKETTDEALARQDEFDSATGMDGLKVWLQEICLRLADKYVPLRTEERLAIEEAHFLESGQPTSRGDALAGHTKFMSAVAAQHVSDNQETDFWGIATGTSAAPPAANPRPNSQSNDNHPRQGKDKPRTRLPSGGGFFKGRSQSAKSEEASRSRQQMDDLLANILAEEKRSTDDR